MASQTNPELPGENPADIDSNTLGGTTSTGAGPDGEQTNAPPETIGLTIDEVGKVAQEVETDKSSSASPHRKE